MSATAVIALVALRRKPPHCSDIATAKAMAIFRNENSTDLAKKGKCPHRASVVLSEPPTLPRRRLKSHRTVPPAGIWLKFPQTARQKRVDV